MRSVHEDLTGQIFGRCIAIEYAGKNKSNRSIWKCQCSCENKTIFIAGAKSLKNGDTKSCGCYKREMASKSNKKYNTYNISGKYGIGYTRKGKEFYFDLDDYDKIKDFCWTDDNNGYLMAYTLKRYKIKMMRMHRLVMNCVASTNGEMIDHINQAKEDNRKENLRIVNQSRNSLNSKISTRNTSGVRGVDWMKNKNKWRARVNFNGNTYHIGLYEYFEDAVNARTNKEIELGINL